VWFPVATLPPSACFFPCKNRKRRDTGRVGRGGGGEGRGGGGGGWEIGREMGGAGALLVRRATTFREGSLPISAVYIVFHALS